MRTSLVCIAKNEDNYIQEWIDYHIKLGFDNIFIYENNWRCKIEHPQVIKIPFDGGNRQIYSYNHFLQNHSNGYDWVGFIDCDEFLVLNEDKSLKDFFERFSDKPGVGVNWKLFGDNGHTKVDNNEYSVIKRFTMRENGINLHIKSFINLNVSKNFHMGVHNPNIPISNQNHDLFIGPFCKNCSTKYAQINHYFCKTFEEFKLKVDRGKADNPSKRSYDEFHPHNINEVEDLRAYKFLYDDNYNLLNT